MTKRLLLALFLLAAVTGSAQAAYVYIPIFIPAPSGMPAAATADYQNIHTVAVISALGTQLNFRNNHFIAPKSDEQDISSWNLDDEIAARLKQYLSGRFAFRDIQYDRATLAKIPNGVWDAVGSKFQAFLKSLNGDGVDAFIVVRPDQEAYAPGVEGLGLENGGPFGDMTPIVWANYEIDIVDARTDKVIAKAYSRLCLRSCAQPSFSGLLTDSALRVGDDFQLSEQQVKLLRLNLSFLLNASMVETLRALNLGVDLPLPGARTMVPILPEKDPYKAFKTVAVVSALGDTLSLESLAPFFVRGKYTAPVPDWRLDSLVEQRLKAALSKRFTVVDPNVDRAAFAKAVVWDDDGKFAPNFPGLNPASGIDLYVVVVKLTRSVSGSKTAGVGIDRASTVESATATAYAHFAVVAIDAHTMKIVAAESGIASPDRPVEMPQKVVDAGLWPKQPAAATPEEIAALHDPIVDVLSNGLDETVLRLGLLGVIPVQGSLTPQASASASP